MDINTPIARVGILLLVGLAVVAVWFALRLWRARHIQQLQGEPLPLPDAVVSQIDGVPAAILAFSTRSCAECRTRQAPALRRLIAALGSRVQVISLDPLEHPDLVARLGILTVPATVVLDAGRQVRHLNLGYASDVQLKAQVTELA